MDRLVGSANEVVTIEDRSSTYLLVSGAMVSTISDTLCADLDLPVQPLSALLEVEGVGGQNLPYRGRGYTVANLTFPGVSPHPIEALFLIVPETSYHLRIPLLIKRTFYRRFCVGLVPHLQLTSPVYGNWP